MKSYSSETREQVHDNLGNRHLERRGVQLGALKDGVGDDVVERDELLSQISQSFISCISQSEAHHAKNGNSKDAQETSSRWKSARARDAKARHTRQTMNSRIRDPIAPDSFRKPRLLLDLPRARLPGLQEEKCGKAESEVPAGVNQQRRPVPEGRQHHLQQKRANGCSCRVRERSLP